MRLLLFAGMLLMQGATTASLEGTVTRMGSSDPLSNVFIELIVQGRPTGGSAQTDKDGHFAIRNIPAGTYVVNASRMGYVHPNQELGALNSHRIGQITFGPNERIQDFHIALAETGTIAGRILAPNGAPIPNVVVESMAISYLRGESTVSSLLRATTDDRGQYRIFGLPAGSYFIIGRPPAGALSNRQPFAPTFFRGERRADRAQTVTVRNGERVEGIDFVLEQGSPLSVSGHVTSPSPTSTISVLSVLPISMEPNALSVPASMFGLNTAHDRFTFTDANLSPGSYDFLVIGTGPDGDAFGMTRVNLGEQSIEGANVVLRPGRDVKGHLTVLGDSSLKFAGIPIHLRSLTLRGYDTSNKTSRLASALAIQRLESRNANTAPSTPNAATLAAAAVAETGSFTIGSVPEGRYAIEPSLPAGAYIVDVRQGDKSILDAGLTVGPEGTEPLEIIVGSNGARLEGVLLDASGAGLGFSQLVLVPDLSRRNNFSLYRTVISDYHGAFSFDGVSPGDYKVFAWDLVADGAWTNAELIKPFEDRGTTVAVKTGESMKGLRIRVIPVN